MKEITYRKLEPSDIDRFIELRKLQLLEEGAKETCDITEPLLDFYRRHMEDNTYRNYRLTVYIVLNSANSGKKPIIAAKMKIPIWATFPS